MHEKSLKEKTYGGIIGLIVGIWLGLFFSQGVETTLMSSFWIRLSTIIGISIAGAIGTTLNIKVQGLGGAIGAAVTIIIFTLGFSPFPGQSLTGDLVAVLLIVFIMAGISALIGGFLGMVFGSVSSLISRKVDGGEYISALGVSIAAAIGAGLVMLFELTG